MLEPGLRSDSRTNAYRYSVGHDAWECYLYLLMLPPPTLPPHLQRLFLVRIDAKTSGKAFGFLI